MVPISLIKKKTMNFEILFQLASLAMIVLAGPLVVILLSTQEGNGL